MSIKIELLKTIRYRKQYKNKKRHKKTLRQKKYRRMYIESHNLSLWKMTHYVKMEKKLKNITYEYKQKYRPEDGLVCFDVGEIIRTLNDYCCTCESHRLPFEIELWPEYLKFDEDRARCFERLHGSIFRVKEVYRKFIEYTKTKNYYYFRGIPDSRQESRYYYLERRFDQFGNNHVLRQVCGTAGTKYRQYLPKVYYKKEQRLNPMFKKEMEDEMNDYLFSNA